MIRWLNRDEQIALAGGLAFLVGVLGALGWVSGPVVLGVAVGTSVYLAGCWLDETEDEPETAADGGRRTDADVTIAGGDRNRHETTSEGN